MLTFLGFTLLILGIGPAFLYIVGRIRDPFHPLIFFGIASYSVAGHNLLTNPGPALFFMPSFRFEYYLLVTIAAVVAFYLGWFKARNKPLIKKLGAGEAYSCDKLLAFSLISIVVGVVVSLITYQDYEGSGYLRDLTFLWVSGAVVGMQVFVYSTSKSQRILAIMGIGLALIVPLDRFIVYGQRSDVLRASLVVMVFYLAKNYRPKKALVVAAGLAFGLVLATLHLTRATVNENPSLGARVEAVFQAIPNFFQTETSYQPGSEFIFGPAAIGAVQDTGRYGYGAGYTLYFVQRFAPRQWFPDKWSWFSTHAGYSQAELTQVMGGTPMTSGAACTGFAQAFCEVWWFSPLIWFVMGYILRRVWDHAVIGSSPMAQGVLSVSLFVIMIGILQQLSSMIIQVVYLVVPLVLIYRMARVNAASEYGVTWNANGKEADSSMPEGAT